MCLEQNFTHDFGLYNNPKLRTQALISINCVVLLYLDPYNDKSKNEENYSIEVFTLLVRQDSRRI